MKKYLLIIIVAILGNIGCSKSDTKIEDKKYMINAKVYAGESDDYSFHIAFIPKGDLPPNLSKSVVKNIFDSKPKYYKYSNQYSEYLPEGEYTILIMSENSRYPYMNGVYTYRSVSNVNGPSQDNIMVFKLSGDNDYQPWNNKK